MEIFSIFTLQEYLWNQMCTSFGCVTPWSFNKARAETCDICRDRNKAKLALAMEKQYNSGFDGKV